MPTNNFLPFCPTDTGTNLLTQGDYAVAADRTIGNQPGVASAKLVNKAIRQPTFVVSQFAQFLSDFLGVDVLDNGVTATLLAQMNAALKPIAPVYQRFTADTTFQLPIVFRITSGSATAGATYTNSGNTYTVVKTVASGLQLVTTGTAAPAAAGTLTKSGGTGDSTIVYQAFRLPVVLEVLGAGAGGGGSGSGISGAGNAADGTASTFGSAMISLGGGAGGVAGGSGGAGGTSSLGTGPTGRNQIGQAGRNGVFVISGANGAPGAGGNTPYFNGGGSNGQNGNVGADGDANTGGGGGGAGTGTSQGGGCGGGSGGFCHAYISNPAYSYAVVIGVGGAAGVAGSSGFAGGVGANGVFDVIAHF